MTVNFRLQLADLLLKLRHGWVLRQRLQFLCERLNLLPQLSFVHLELGDLLSTGVPDPLQLLFHLRVLHFALVAVALCNL